MKKVILAAATGVILAGCQQKPDEDAIKACWNPDAKSTVTSIAKEALQEKISDFLKDAANGRPVPTKQEVLNALSVNLTNFYTVSLDRTADSADCGARVDMVYTRPDGKSLRGSDVYIEFQTLRSETGRMYSIKSTLPLAQLITSASVADTDPAPTPQAVPQSNDADTAAATAAAIAAASDAAAAASAAAADAASQ